MTEAAPAKINLCLFVGPVRADGRHALGADVPAQVQPGRALAAGAGERIRRLAPPPRFGVLVLPSRQSLSTAAVYAEADRLGLPRDADGLAERLWAVEQSLGAEGAGP